MTQEQELQEMREARIQEMINIIDGYGSEIYGMPPKEVACLVGELVQNATLKEALEAVKRAGLM